MGCLMDPKLTFVAQGAVMDSGLEWQRRPWGLSGLSWLEEEEDDPIRLYIAAVHSDPVRSLSACSGPV